MKVIITRRESLHLPDGINVSIFAIADELLRRGHEVTAISTCRVSPETVKRTFRAERYPEFASITQAERLGYFETGMAWLKSGRVVVAKHKPDVAIINGALPVKLPGRNIVVSHDIEQRLSRFGPLRILYKRFSYRRADCIVGTCSEVADTLAAELKLNRERVVIIPTCMRLDNYSPKPLAQRTRTILHMGTVDYKNPLATLSAFARIADECDSQLIVTGKLSDEIKQFQTTLSPSVQERIKFPGFVSAEELKELIESIRIVSVPSQYNTPVASPTVLESFAAHTPVACSTSISKDIIADRVNSLIAIDHGSMASAFRRLLTDDSLWQTLSAGAAKAVENYSAEKVCTKYEALFPEKS